MEVDNHYLTLREIQLAELDMLVKFDRFCKENDLRYSIIYGTMLGAVRHKGFIPWDDDIDVMMPRSDYERLIDLLPSFEQSTGCELAQWCGTSLKVSPFIKMINPDYRAKQTIAFDSTYLWIDIFPTDSFKDAKSANAVIQRNQKWLASIYVTKRESFSVRNKWKRVASAVARPLLKAIRFDCYAASKITATAQSSRCDSGKISAPVTFSFGAWFETSAWNELIDIEFERRTFKCIPCWDAVLTRQYGDYMVLPDEDKRVTHKLLVWKSEQ